MRTFLPLLLLAMIILLPKQQRITLVYSIEYADQEAYEAGNSFRHDLLKWYATDKEALKDRCQEITKQLDELGPDYVKRYGYYWRCEVVPITPNRDSSYAKLTIRAFNGISAPWYSPAKFTSIERIYGDPGHNLELLYKLGPQP